MSHSSVFVALQCIMMHAPVALLIEVTAHAASLTQVAAAQPADKPWQRFTRAASDSTVLLVCVSVLGQT